MNNRFWDNNIQFPLFPILRGRPQAVAFVKGSESQPEISGVVRFYQTDAGVIVYAEIRCPKQNPIVTAAYSVFIFMRAHHAAEI